MAEPPRIGLLTASVSTAAGGLFFVLRDLASRLQGHGIPQAVFGLNDPALAADRARWQIANLSTFDGAGPAAFRISPALSRALEAADLDVLHLHGIWNSASFAAWRWRRRTRRPLLISPHGMLDPGALTFSARKKRVAGAFYERANLRGATAIHALNQPEADAVRAFGIDAPIAVIANGVDLPAASVVEARDWSCDGRKTVLFLARLHPKKGVQQVIAAWRLLLDSAPETGAAWQLVVAGWDDGGMRDTARRQISALGLEAHVTLPGALFGDAKRSAFAGAHAFILPSRSEGLPVSVLEAWSYGLPVFMTEACNLPTGFATDAAVRIEADPASMATTLAQTLGHMERLRTIGRNGRALVAREYGWDGIVDQYIALYHWLANGGTVPSFVQFPTDRDLA